VELDLSLFLLGVRMEERSCGVVLLIVRGEG
jgi:hypothetical protein